MMKCLCLSKKIEIMKVVYKILGTLIVLILLSSCSSVKVTDSWRNLEVPDIKNKKIMVVSKTDDKITRMRFEKDLVQHLNQNGYQSIESYIMFPKSSPTKELTELETIKIKEELKSKGVGIVIMTILKDSEEYTTTTTTSNNSYNEVYPPYYGLSYYRGFYRYYGTIYVKSDPVTMVTMNVKKYTLETVVFDLTQPEEKQLLSVITTEIDDPKVLGKISTDFSKRIVKELDK